MQLGKLQQNWVTALRKHPERQGKHILGKRKNGSYTACPLGELLLTHCRMKRYVFPFVQNGAHEVLRDGKETVVLERSWKRFGLRSEAALLDKERMIGSVLALSITEAADEGATWAEIADFVEMNPGAVFVKSV